MGLNFSKETVTALAQTADLLITQLKGEFPCLNDIQLPRQPKPTQFINWRSKAPHGNEHQTAQAPIDFTKLQPFEVYCKNNNWPETTAPAPNRETLRGIYTLYLIALIVKDYAPKLKTLSIFTFFRHLQNEASTIVEQRDREPTIEQEHKSDEPPEIKRPARKPVRTKHKQKENKEKQTTLLKGLGLFDYMDYLTSSEKDQKCLMHCISSPKNSDEKFCQNMLNESIKYLAGQNLGKLPSSNMLISIATSMSCLIPMLRWPRYLQIILDSIFGILEKSSFQINEREGQPTNLYPWIYIIYIVSTFMIEDSNNPFNMMFDDHTGSIRRTLVQTALKAGHLQSDDLLQVDWYHRHLQPWLKHHFSNSLLEDIDVPTTDTPGLSDILTEFIRKHVSSWANFGEHLHIKICIVSLWQNIVQFLTLNFINIKNAAISVGKFANFLKRKQPQPVKKNASQQDHHLDDKNSIPLAQHNLNEKLNHLLETEVERQRKKAIRKTMDRCFSEQRQHTYTILAPFLSNPELLNSLTWPILRDQYIPSIIDGCLSIIERYKTREHLEQESLKVLEDDQACLEILLNVLILSKKPLDMRIRQCIDAVAPFLLTAVQECFPQFLLIQKEEFLELINKMGAIITKDCAEQEKEQNNQLDTEQARQQQQQRQQQTDQAIQEQAIHLLEWLFKPHRKRLWSKPQPSPFEIVAKQVEHSIQKGLWNQPLHKIITLSFDLFLWNDWALDPRNNHNNKQVEADRRLKWLATQLVSLEDEKK